MTVCTYYTPWNNSSNYYFPTQPPARIGGGGNVNQMNGGASATYGGQCTQALGVGTRTGGYVRYRVTRTASGETSMGNDTLYTTYAYYVCLSTFVDTPVQCAYSVGARFEGPFENAQLPTPVQPRTITFPDEFSEFKRQYDATGRWNIALCDQAFEQEYNVRVTDYGKYQLVATGRQIACTLRRYTSPDPRIGGTRPDEITSCGNTSPYSRNTFLAQLYCSRPGWSRDWVDRGPYSAEQCETRDPQVWNCANNWDNQLPSFAGNPQPGRNGANAVLDDGNKRPATWLSPTLPGVSNVRDTNVRLDVRNDSTPFRPGMADNHPEQPFRGNLTTAHATENGTLGPNRRPDAWHGRQNTSWDLQFYKAGKPNQPWSATPTWEFTGEIQQTIITIRSVNVRTGNMDVRTEAIARTITEDCVGNAVNIDVFRARTTSVR